MIYRYVAYDIARNVIEGIVEAETESLARETLERSGHRLLAIKPGRPKLNLRQLFPSLFPVKAGDVIVFSRLLATLLERGTTVLAALQLLEDQTGNITFREVINSIIEDLSRGHSFSEAVGQHPEAFSLVYRQTVKVAEQTGNLEEILRQMADYMERESEIKAKVAKALMYPAVVMVVAMGVITLLLTFVLPNLLEVFTDLGAELPLTTRLVVGLTGFLSSYKLYLLAVVFVTVVAFLWYRRTPRGRKKLDSLMLKIPIIGRLNVIKEMAHFSRTMSMLLEAGLPMTEVIETMIETSRNAVVRDALQELQQGILHGRGLSRPMSENPLFPRLLTQMARVGEEAGTLATDLNVIAYLYTKETDEKVSALLRLMEPMMFVVLGTVVAFIAISVILPIYTVMGSIQ